MTTTESTTPVIPARTAMETAVAKEYGIPATGNRTHWAVAEHGIVNIVHVTRGIVATVSPDPDNEVPTLDRGICAAHALCVADQANMQRQWTKEARWYQIAQHVAGFAWVES